MIDLSQNLTLSSQVFVNILIFFSFFFADCFDCYFFAGEDVGSEPGFGKGAFSKDFAEEVVADAFVVVEVFGFGGYEVVWGEVAAVDFGVGVAFLHFDGENDDTILSNCL